MLTPAAAFWLMVVWLVAMGGAVGSFLNVVVYQLPLGMSIVHPPSRCPKCGNFIAWYDNVPVIGWIMLRGRCRNCHNPISARYPIVEAVTALMFGALAVVELPLMNRMDFYGLYPYHLLLLCTLLCAGLIEFDGHRAPWRLFLPALVVGFAAPLVWPQLRPMSAAIELRLSPDYPSWMIGGLDALVGLASGALVGAMAWGFIGSEKPRGLLLGLLSAGLFLGWQAVLMVALWTGIFVAPMWLPQRASPRLRIPSSLIFFCVTLVLMLAVCGIFAFVVMQPLP